MVKLIDVGPSIGYFKGKAKWEKTIRYVPEGIRLAVDALSVAWRMHEITDCILQQNGARPVNTELDQQTEHGAKAANRTWC